MTAQIAAITADDPYPGPVPVAGTWKEEGDSEEPCLSLAQRRDIQVAAIEKPGLDALSPRQEAALEARRVFTQEGKAKSISELLATGIAPLPHQGTKDEILARFLESLDGVLPESDEFWIARSKRHVLRIWAGPVAVSLVSLAIPPLLAAYVAGPFILLLLLSVLVTAAALILGAEWQTSRVDREWGLASSDILEVIDDEQVPAEVIRLASAAGNRLAYGTMVHFTVHYPVRYGLSASKHDIVERRRDAGMLMIEKRENPSAEDDDDSDASTDMEFATLAQW